VFIYLPLPTDDVEQISQTVPASAAAIRYTYVCIYGGFSGGFGGGCELDTHLIVRHLRYFIFFLDENRIYANKFHYVQNKHAQ